MYIDTFLTPFLYAFGPQNLLDLDYGVDLVLVLKRKLRCFFAPRPNHDAQHSHLLEGGQGADVEGLPCVCVVQPDISRQPVADFPANRITVQASSVVKCYHARWRWMLRCTWRPRAAMKTCTEDAVDDERSFAVRHAVLRVTDFAPPQGIRTQGNRLHRLAWPCGNSLRTSRLVLTCLSREQPLGFPSLQTSEAGRCTNS
jgi:hypothetical protein